MPRMTVDETERDVVRAARELKALQVKRVKLEAALAELDQDIMAAEDTVKSYLAPRQAELPESENRLQLAFDPELEPSER